MSKLKHGYITVFIDGKESFIANSHGFSFQSLKQINEQIKEPEEFENMHNTMGVFKASYCEPEKDIKGRTIVKGYWDLNRDDYCRRKERELEEELHEFIEYTK